MNYIKEAENYLHYYRELQKSIKTMKRELSRLFEQQEPKTVKATQYDITGIPGMMQQDEAYNVLFKIQKITDSIRTTEKAIKEIDIILDDISIDEGCELYGLVLRMWYINKIPKEEIAEEVSYSSRQSVYDIRNKAIRKFAVRLFGLEALKMI